MTVFSVPSFRAVVRRFVIMATFALNLRNTACDAVRQNM